MSGQVTRKSGEILYLEAQLIDGEASLPLRIIADLLNGDGSLIKTVELTHTSKGVFIEDAETMPNASILIAKYYVYESNGTTLSTVFGVSEDRFMLDTGEAGGSFDLSRNGHTVIKVKKDKNININPSSSDTIINVERKNVKIMVSDDDTEINIDGDNINLGVTK
ncbi:MAG: hypothetical protein IMF01_09405 [Proteobacteria bacterium]|nr:hypothetical protein [Pseudomonadota bacterium]